MRRIIFLDVDGVLNNSETKHRVHPMTSDDMPHGMRGGYIGMDPTCIKNLQTLIEKSGAEVVLSSTWRKEPFGLGKTERVARRQGYGGPRWIDVTPVGVRQPLDEGVYGGNGYGKFSNRGSTPRGLEIQQWLDDNTKGEQVEFVILDDDTDMAHLSPRLVNTDFSVGFTEEKLAEALKLFGIDP